MAQATVAAMAKAIKKLGSADSLPKIPAVAAECGVELNEVKDVYLAEPVAFPELKLKPTQAGVVKGVKMRLRDERIAARTGLTLKEVREYKDAAGVGGEYLGRGRKPGSGNGAAKPKAASGRRGQPKKDEGKGTSGRRGRGAAKPAAASGRPRGRRGTRAGAADPK